MHFRIFSLQPTIFDSFFSTSLIARGLAQGVFSQEVVNWRDSWGVGNYKQADDRPYGGSHGMVLQTEPIFQALLHYGTVSPLFQPSKIPTEHTRILPNNSAFEELVRTRKQAGNPIRSVTIHLTPRGFSYNQPVAEWLATEFDTINLLCGRYEGFDARVNETVDLELSVGNYVLNGGEVAALSVVESVARLLPGFLVKEQTAEHDSWSKNRLIHTENMEFVLGKKRMAQSTRVVENYLKTETITKLFENKSWLETILPHIEHPQYTRPEIWQNWKIPELLKGGNHKNIDSWRNNWWKL